MSIDTCKKDAFHKEQEAKLVEIRDKYVDEESFNIMGLYNFFDTDNCKGCVFANKSNRFLLIWLSYYVYRIIEQKNPDQYLCSDIVLDEKLDKYFLTHTSSSTTLDEGKDNINYDAIYNLLDDLKKLQAPFLMYLYTCSNDSIYLFHNISFKDKEVRELILHGLYRDIEGQLKPITRKETEDDNI